MKGGRAGGGSSAVQPGTMKILRRLLQYQRPYWYLVFSSLALIFVVSGLGLVTPWILKWVVDEGLSRGNYRLLLPAALAIFLVAVVRGALTFAQRYTIQYTSNRIIYDLRNLLYNHLQQLSFGFYDQAQTGQLMSRLTADVETLNQFLGMGLVQLTSNIFTFLGVLTVLFGLDWRLTLVSMATMPFLFYAVYQMARKVRPMFYQVQQQMAVLTATLQENVTGMRVVKAFARENHEVGKFQKDSREYMRRNVTAARLQAFYVPFMNFLTAASTALIIWYGGLEVTRGRLSLGTLIAFNTYLTQLVMPVRMLGLFVNLAERAMASSQRIFELLDTRAEVQDSPTARPLPRLGGHVRFDHASFSYDGKVPVLDDINLEVQPGQTIAILGATGSGKSSLINLIPRFYDVTGGRVLIDGQDVRDVTLESLRRQIGVVTQETFLFSATLRENIAYGKPEATMEEIIRAAKAAHIHDFIMTLPRRYDTIIGERGVGLSGGQKQRVAIARALLMDARILLLDESTSSVDAETEYRIQKAFAELLQRRTSFIIAQRLSTVRNADRIIVLERGRIVEEGTHEELLGSGGIYSRIYHLQLLGQKEAAPGERSSAPDPVEEESGYHPGGGIRPGGAAEGRPGPGMSFGPGQPGKGPHRGGSISQAGVRGRKPGAGVSSSHFDPLK